MIQKNGVHNIILNMLKLHFQKNSSMMSTLYLLDLKSNSCAFAKKTWHFYELVFHMILEPLWQSGFEFKISISIQYD